MCHVAVGDLCPLRQVAEGQELARPVVDAVAKYGRVAGVVDEREACVDARGELAGRGPPEVGRGGDVGLSEGVCVAWHRLEVVEETGGDPAGRDPGIPWAVGGRRLFEETVGFVKPGDRVAADLKWV